MNQLSQKYVRIVNAGEKFVEFNFAIGDPTLYAELILPKKAFEAFCENNQVQFIDDTEAEVIERDERKWRYGEESIMSNLLTR